MFFFYRTRRKVGSELASHARRPGPYPGNNILMSLKNSIEGVGKSRDETRNVGPRTQISKARKGCVKASRSSDGLTSSHV